MYKQDLLLDVYVCSNKKMNMKKKVYFYSTDNLKK